MRSPVRSCSIAIVALLSTALILPTPTAAGGPVIMADLDGRPIPAVEVGEWNCHDFEFPLVRCYRTPAELDAAVVALGYEPLAGAAESSSSPSGPLPDTLLAVSYVRVFVHASYAGNSAYFSVDYPNLGTIGWNDKISSFVALNGASGQFFEHANYVGFIYSFCCNQRVPYVGDFYNDKFSSVWRTS